MPLEIQARAEGEDGLRVMPRTFQPGSLEKRDATDPPWICQSGSGDGRGLYLLACDADNYEEFCHCWRRHPHGELLKKNCPSRL
jgi:hypothetical protein